jgi:hypothetical protein
MVKTMWGRWAILIVEAEGVMDGSMKKGGRFDDVAQYARQVLVSSYSQ